MTKLAFQQFNGELPRTQAHFLPEGMAVVASNTRLSSGTLKPMRGGSEVYDFGSTGHETAVLHLGQWIGWDHDTDAVTGPVADDRLYVTHENAAPQLFAGGVWLPLALPNPTVAPTVTLAGTVDEELAEDVIYAYTWVTALGEESGPSPVSDPLKFSAGVTLSLAALPTVTSVSGRPVSKKRIYRSQTSATGITDLYFIAEIGAAVATFDDVHGENPIAEAISTKDFDPPPANMEGLIALSGGMMAAFDGKEILFCEPYQPHAWPGKYALTAAVPVIGLCAIGTSVAVMTAGMPYLIQGLAPDSMTMTKVDSPYPCVAKRGIVDMGYAAIYPSPVGLVALTETGASVVTTGIWAKDDWEALNPSSFDAARLGESYVFSYLADDATERRVAVLNLNGETPTLIHVDLSTLGFWNQPESNKTFFIDDDGAKVFEFDAGLPLTYTWKSKPYRFPSPVSFSVVKLETPDSAVPPSYGEFGIIGQTAYAVGLRNATVSAEDELTVTLDVAAEILGEETSMTVELDLTAGADPYTLRIFADGIEKRVIDNQAGTIQRIPAGKHREWSIEITGTAEVLGVGLAQSVQELLAQ